MLTYLESSNEFLQKRGYRLTPQRYMKLWSSMHIIICSVAGVVHCYILIMIYLAIFMNK